MKRIRQLELRVDVHGDFFYCHAKRINELAERVKTLEEHGLTEFQLDLLREKIDLLYNYLKLEVRFHPPMTDIAKKGQKKR